MGRRNDRRRRQARRESRFLDDDPPVESSADRPEKEVCLSFVARGGARLNLVGVGVRVPQEIVGADGEGLVEATLGEVLQRLRQEVGQE